MSDFSLSEFNSLNNYVEYKIKDAYQRTQDARNSGSALMYNGNTRQIQLWYAVKQSLELDFCSGVFNDIRT